MIEQEIQEKLSAYKSELKTRFSDMNETVFKRLIEQKLVSLLNQTNKGKLKDLSVETGIVDSESIVFFDDKRNS